VVRRITDPNRVDHDELRELAKHAAWVAKLEDAVELLEDLSYDLLDDEAEDESTTFPDPWEEDPLDVALSVLMSTYEEADRALEADVTEWLAKDPEHWPIFRLVIFDPWWTKSNRWRSGTPGWVISLGTNTVLAHFQQDPFGRRRVIDLDSLN
jgi:hypothetical protein